MNPKRGIISILLFLIFFLTACSSSPTGLSAFEEMQMLLGEDVDNSFGLPSIQPSATLTNDSCFTASLMGAMSGDVIELTTNITSGGGGCVDLDIANITFDCKGFSITGSGAGAAIDMNSDNITVQDCTIHAAGFPSEVTADVSSVKDSKFLNNTHNGTMFMSGSNMSVIRENTWIDLDNSTDSMAALLADASNDLLFEQNTLGMIAECSFCDNGKIVNNSLQNNGLLEFSGDGNLIADNRWTDISIQGTTSGGIEATATFGPGTVRNNVLANGQMLSIILSGPDILVANNTLENITGTGIILGLFSDNVTIVNNTIRNLTGVAIMTDTGGGGNDITIKENLISFVLKLVNTTLNLGGTTTPAIPEGDVGILLSGGDTGTKILSNRIEVSNPSSLEVGVIGLQAQEASGVLVNGNIINGTKIGMFLQNTTNTNVTNNNITESTHKGIIIESGSGNRAEDNNIVAAAPIDSPSLFEAGVQLLRTRSNSVGSSNITGYHHGLYVFNGTGNNLFDLLIRKASDGVFSFQSRLNNFTRVFVEDSEVGFQFLFTNNSTINQSNISTTLHGFEFFKSFSNTLDESNQTGAEIGLLLDLFSSGNTVSNSSFTTNSDKDIVYDMFATGNTGADNTFATTRSENGASGNTIS